MLQRKNNWNENIFTKIAWLLYLGHSVTFYEIMMYTKQTFFLIIYNLEITQKLQNKHMKSDSAGVLKLAVKK